jgi:protein MPE1
MSHVYYKFKSQKDPSRVLFDGPGISVFDLKREIISLNKLGAGTDFDLSIYDESTNEGIGAQRHGADLIEYTDDNAIIPRATSIIVRRLPPSKPGKGNGAKYVSGSASMGRHPRSENFGKKTNDITAKSSLPLTAPVVRSSIPSRADKQPTSGDDESAAIASMMSAQSANWDSTQEKMAMANPVYNRYKKPLVAVPDKPPPLGYICHRCGEKGHWIQACPTNDDPNFDNKPRIKRTTGIPKTFLKRADKPVFDDDGEGKINGVMVDADGEYVVVEPDSKSWVNYQAKSTAKEGDIYSQPLPAEHKDWECQICGKLIKDATRTPCCKSIFCDECIQSALLESDFVCPSCGANEILLDDLIADADVRSQIAAYIKKWEEEKTANTSETERVISSRRKSQTNSQKSIVPPSETARKRSRSPTPSDDSSNKKPVIEGSKSPATAKPTSSDPIIPTGPNYPFDSFNQQFNGMPPFMPPMLGMPFPPFPPDPFMMAAMGFPPPMPDMMMPMANGMFPQQGYNQQRGNNMGGQIGDHGGRQMAGRTNTAYRQGPVNERGMRRMQRDTGGTNRNQADYKELI